MRVCCEHWGMGQGSQRLGCILPLGAWWQLELELKASLCHSPLLFPMCSSILLLRSAHWLLLLFGHTGWKIASSGCQVDMLQVQAFRKNLNLLILIPNSREGNLEWLVWGKHSPHDLGKG